MVNKLGLPTLCFDVVDMGVITNGNGCDHLAYVSAVFHNCVTQSHCLDGYFVPMGMAALALIVMVRLSSKMSAVMF